MALVEWNGSLVTGDPTIDADHKRLVSYVNELHAALIVGKARSYLGRSSRS